ncbi:hypothetical protein B0H14DRAFT_3670007 [Mycena olivaceomarginata]|nr:hypothetical protein B0H14DRAFT_3670007 [Mycena olivaceomarginata]
MLVTSRTSPERTEEELADREYNEGEDDKRSAGVDARQQGLQGSDTTPDHDAHPAVNHIEREPVIGCKPAKHEAVNRQEPPISWITKWADRTENIPVLSEGTATRSAEHPRKKSGANEHDVCLKCVEEEAAEQEWGVLPINNVSPSAFIIAGLDLEEQQRHIKVAVAITQKLESSKLACYVARFRKLQAVYMLGALQALTDHPITAGEEGGMLAENMPLFLPSALLAELRASGCNKGVDRIEQRFRDAQCRSALDGIRNYLHIKSRFRMYKGGQVRLQGATTRADGLGEVYCGLGGKAGVGRRGELDWHHLDPKKDLRCMDEEEDRVVVSERKRRGRKQGKGEVGNKDVRDGVQEGQRRKDPTGEGRRTMLWIWMGVDTSSTGTSKAVLILNTGLRVKWCKAWARTRHWTEEVQLLKEEMRCTPLALRYKARWWLERWAPTGFEGHHAEGATAYATSQAVLYNDLVDSFEKLWAPLMGLEDVDDAVLLRLNKKRRTNWIQRRPNEEDGNDGVDGEEGREEEQNGEEEEEGSAGGESDGEDDD